MDGDQLYEVSLREALEDAGGAVALAPEFPTVLPALLRQVLVPVTIAALGPPRDKKEWVERFEAGRFPKGPIEEYLEERRDRFDLFHPEHPFAQVGGLRTPKGEVKPSSLLIPSIATGNNVPLFTPITEGEPPALTPAEALRWLLHTHCWDTAGIKTGAEGDPAMKGGKTTGNPVGPLGRLGVVVPRGRNLFETIMLNTPIVPDGRDPDDLPQWERPPATAAWKERDPTGILDLLTWQSRRIRLIPEGEGEDLSVLSVVVAAGDRMFSTPDYEPHTAWQKTKNPKADDPPKRPLRVSSDKQAWRGLDALLSVDRKSSDGKYETSELLAQAATLEGRELPDSFPLQVNVVGIEYGTQSAVVENLVADSIPLPVVALRTDDVARALLRQIVNNAEDAARAVDFLDADLRQAAGGDPVPWDKGQRWGTMVVVRLDPVVRRLLAVLQHKPDAVEAARKVWEIEGRRVLVDVAEELLSAVSPDAHRGRSEDEAGKRVHRVATAELRFRKKLSELFPRPDPGDGNLEFADPWEEDWT